MNENSNKTREQLLVEISTLCQENAQLRKLLAEQPQEQAVSTESERRYKELADLLPETIVEFDASCNFTFVNVHGLETFGYTRQDIETGLNVFQTIAPEDHDRAKEAVEMVLRGEESGGHEYAMVKKDGSRFPGFIHASLIIRNETVQGLRAIVVDITERKRAEQALKNSEEELRSLFAAMTDVILVLDSEGRYVRIAPTNPLNLYRPPEQMLGKRLHEVLPQYDADAILNQIEMALKNQQIVSFEYKLDIGSKEVWFDGRVSPLTGNTVFWIARDITDRKKAEEVIREAHDRAQQYLDIAGVMILVLDQGGRIVLLNKKGHAILGYEEGELTGKDWIATCLPSGIRGEATGAFQALMNGEIESVEYYENPVATKQGTVRLIAWHNTLLKDREGRIVGSLSSGEDITEHKHAGEQIRASLREKEVLLKEIHHRVKNNLQVISSLLNMQSRYVREGVEAFRESVNRIRSMALIHEKLYRSENLSRIHFADYINDLSHELLSTYATEKGVELDLNIDPLSFDVDTAIPLGLIISELVSNSLKHAFLERSGGKITIHLGSIGDQVLLSISDNGIGFPKSIDFRNTPSLGMQLVVTLVEQLDGSILLNRDGGTEFRIVFQAAE